MRRRAVTVARAISAAEALFVDEAPGVTMFGFKRVPTKIFQFSKGSLDTFNCKKLEIRASNRLVSGGYLVLVI